MNFEHLLEVSEELTLELKTKMEELITPINNLEELSATIEGDVDI